MTDTENWVKLDSIAEDNADLARDVAARCSFQLRYSRAEEARRFTPEELTGERLDDAQTPGATFTGNWSAGDHPGMQYMTSEIRRLDERDWLNHYAHLAVGEAIHEALEWFQVDGQPWLDPHGDMQSYIYDEVEQFVKRLVGVREQWVAEEAQRACDVSGEVSQ
ncbi:hypothetical protein EV383_4460 [Pseudonocardia sediminis]|uniref:Uncharacterized protein n=1 Tax=Pseudonocardia sediminis TaxID=1397368 RepID=A0A4Q7V0D1_PSEST|nr:hypothetical protein [Pseudonocardia sediminis]RZT87535.1 hypothetical protein EV383_4460 [Pseudonocardia sediminis]